MSDPAKANELIYQKCNEYRLHADNLRWTLLAGYGVFFGAAINSIKELSVFAIDRQAMIYLLLWVISLLYLLVLGVQNWFYNLFALFVNECETRFLRGDSLRSMDEFAREQGPGVTPFHPAFFFALTIVLLSSATWLCLAVRALMPPVKLTGPTVSVWAIPCEIFLIHLLVFIYVFRKWETIVYRRLIMPLSNLWRKATPKISAS